MSWEIEHTHMDLAEMMHVTTFVERGVRNRNGEPTRHLLQVRLGNGLTLTEDGTLVEADGKALDVRAKQQEMLSALNRAHELARVFARRHGAQVGAPPKLGR